MCVNEQLGIDFQGRHRRGLRRLLPLARSAARRAQAARCNHARRYSLFYSFPSPFSPSSECKCMTTIFFRGAGAGWDEMVEAQREGSACHMRLDSTCYKYREKLSPALVVLPETHATTSPSSSTVEWRVHKFESKADPNDTQPFAFSSVLAGYVQVRF